MSEWFGELRGLLHGSASREGMIALVELLRGATPQQLDESSRYVEQSLARGVWFEQLSCTPYDWLGLAGLGLTPPPIELRGWTTLVDAQVGQHPLRRYLCSSDEVLVGRAPYAEIMMPGKPYAREHYRYERGAEGAMRIRHLGSVHAPTLLDPRTGERRVVRHHTCVEVSSDELAVVADAPNWTRARALLRLEVGVTVKPAPELPGTPGASGR